MNKKLLLALAATVTTPLYAGGLVTNTNQNAAFLRQLSQDAIIDITGLYMNPAGTAFLAPGAHVSFNIQNAKQSRDIATNFPLFAYNKKNPNTTHKFEGDAYAPVIPSIQFSYNWEKWSINANFALGGGGGKCEFDAGLGSFEALYADQLYNIVPGAVSTVVGQMAGIDPKYKLNNYELNAFMKGRQYYFGLSIGATYKVMDNLAVFGGLRAVYATNNYNGWVTNITANLETTLPTPYKEALAAANMAQYSYKLSDNEIELNADQEGWGLTPMLGIDWKINDQWNVAAKYEFKTRLRLENKSEMNQTAKLYSSEYINGVKNPEYKAILGQFADGTKIAADIPSLLTLGVQYAPISALRLQTGFHWYNDKSATQFNNKELGIDKDTWEITAGVEYDLCKWVTLSGGWQATNYGLSDGYMNDLSFTTNSNSWGVGARVNISEKWNIDLGFMQTIYKDRTVTTPISAGVNKIDTYSRTNRVLGIGLNFNF